MAFFKPIAAFGSKVQWTFTFYVDENEFITGSYSLNAKDLTSKVLRSIQPLQFNGTAEELDNGLVAAMTTPAVQNVELIHNLQTHKASLELAKKTAEQEQEKEKSKGTTVSTGPTSKHVVKDPRAKKYETAMEKVRELEKQKKYGQAMVQLPKVIDYPEKKAEITTKANELRAKRGDMNLFDQAPPAENLQPGDSSMTTEPPNSEEDLSDNGIDGDPTSPGESQQFDEGGGEEADDDEDSRIPSQLELLEK